MSRKRKEIDTTTYAGKFALHLRSLREERKMTVEELSEKSGIPRRTIFSWESATRKPQIDDCLVDLVDALKINIGDLLPTK
jgi:transcriptional regulator with XRE-family HTH domain